jgi:hypothetical protein
MNHFRGASLSLEYIMVTIDLIPINDTQATTAILDDALDSSNNDNALRQATTR